MNNAVINFPLPANEPVKAYMPGSPERVALEISRLMLLWLDFLWFHAILYVNKNAVLIKYRL